MKSEFESQDAYSLFWTRAINITTKQEEWVCIAHFRKPHFMWDWLFGKSEYKRNEKFEDNND